MEIDIIGFTENPEFICAVAMKSTRMTESAHEILSEMWNESCFDDENRKALKAHECKTESTPCGVLPPTGGNEKCEYYDWCIERLLNSAKKMGHWGVFEHAYFTISVKGVSRALTHQLVRHRIASYSQQSQRHVDPSTDPDWYVIPESIKGSFYAEEYDQLMERIELFYLKLSHTAIKAEDIRFILPNACKTNIVITMNARSWLHFFKLRLDKSAQWEIREMAQAILDKLKLLAPIIFDGAGDLNV